jgi:hypothetical protein
MPELHDTSPLLLPDGQLAQVGWSRHPLLDCNLEQAAFYPPPLRFWQKMRVKRWDYYGVFTPKRFFSATIADLGYAANVFVYILDFAKNELKEESRVLLQKDVQLPRNSDDTAVESSVQSKEMRIAFRVETGKRLVSVDWPGF